MVRNPRVLDRCAKLVRGVLGVAHRQGQALRSLELGEALRLLFGGSRKLPAAVEESYNEFRKKDQRLIVTPTRRRIRGGPFCVIAASLLWGPSPASPA